MAETLREWEPLTSLFSQLPTRAQHGIFSFDIKLTCVDILPEHIALGTNFGLVYWYDRKKKDIQKLRCENATSPITTVKIISSVDYMVACGNAAGQVSVFQVPKSHPETLPESLRRDTRNVERYTVSELHSSSISALKWSKNGMKLFSGDKHGHVVLTEIDFYMHLCKSVEILNESYEVVQISYHHQMVLVSTTYRSIICRKDEKWKVVQVGKKDRKVLGNFGAIFYSNGIRPTDIGIYSTRPGLRIWVSDTEGVVHQTLLFKDVLSKECPEVPLINPLPPYLQKLQPQKEIAFGTLQPFADDLLVSFNNGIMYVLDPKKLTILATVNHLRGIIDVAVCKDEIFVLEEDRSLVRLSYHPENSHDSTQSLPSPSLTTSIRDFTHKLQNSTIIASIPSLFDSSDNSDAIPIETNAVEATESPKKYEKYSETNKLKILDRISQQDFDDTILYKHRQRKRHTGSSASLTSYSSNSSGEQEVNIAKPTLMTMSTVGILPDLRSPEKIKSDIEDKERMLADLLCFDRVKVNTTDLSRSSGSVEREREQDAVKDDSCDLDLQSNGKRNVLENSTGTSIEDSSSSYTDSNSFSIKPFGTISPFFNPKQKDGLRSHFREPLFKNNLSTVPGSISIDNLHTAPHIRKPLQLLHTEACKDIPNDWKLKTLNTNEQTRKASESGMSDISDEWEIV